MYNRKFEVYTLWELAIPIKNIKSTSIGESKNNFHNMKYDEE